MRKMLNKSFNRITYSLCLIFSALIGFAYNPADEEMILDTVGVDSVVIVDSNEFKPIDIKHFDRDLIPCKHIYGERWDSMNVDSFLFDPSTMATGYELQLVDDECGYSHPWQGRITSRFGWRKGRMHKGIDIDLVTGDKVVAAFDGVVRISKYNYGGFGHYVLIRHYNGLETIYGHLSKRLVNVNQTVRAGEIIGLGGNTGRSTGSHLHFETRFRGKAFDPEKIIDFVKGELKVKQVMIEKEWFLYVTNPWAYQKKYAKYHTIRSGDTLSHIARRYGTSVSALCRMNGMSRNTVLRIGRTIRVR